MLLSFYDLEFGLKLLGIVIYVLFLQLELLFSIYDFWCLVFLVRISCHMMIIDRQREEKLIIHSLKKSGNDNKDTPSASDVDISIFKELTQLGSQVVEQCVDLIFIYIL